MARPRSYNHEIRCLCCGSNRTPKDGHSIGKQPPRSLSGASSIAVKTAAWSETYRIDAYEVYGWLEPGSHVVGKDSEVKRNEGHHYRDSIDRRLLGATRQGRQAR